MTKEKDRKFYLKCLNTFWDIYYLYNVSIDYGSLFFHILLECSLKALSVYILPICILTGTLPKIVDAYEFH